MYYSVGRYKIYDSLLCLCIHSTNKGIFIFLFHWKANSWRLLKFSTYLSILFKNLIRTGILICIIIVYLQFNNIDISLILFTSYYVRYMLELSGVINLENKIVLSKRAHLFKENEVRQFRTLFILIELYLLLVSMRN